MTWVYGPAWLLAAPTQDGASTITQETFEPRGAAPYYVPSSIPVTFMFAPTPILDFTFHGGSVSSISEIFHP
jgi:hypothetical protein